MENLNDNIFYTIEKSIKSYRQFAQRNITKARFDITIRPIARTQDHRGRFFGDTTANYEGF